MIKKILNVILKFFGQELVSISLLDETNETLKKTAKLMDTNKDLLTERDQLVRGNHQIELYHLRVKYEERAREAHNRQNAQIDGFFKTVLERTMNPMIVAMYIDDHVPIRGLNSKISFFYTNENEFGRHVEISMANRKIGEARFTIKIRGNDVFLDLTETKITQ